MQLRFFVVSAKPNSDKVRTILGNLAFLSNKIKTFISIS